MYARTLFRGAKTCKIWGGGEMVCFWSYWQILEKTCTQIKENVCKNAYLGSIFIPEKYVFRVCFERGGVTYMYLPFGALFREIWYSDRGVSSETKEPKLHKLGVFGAKYCKKHPIWSNCVLFFRKWYTDGWEIRQKIGIEIVRFSRSGRHIHVRFWWKKPPPGFWKSF